MKNYITPVKIMHYDGTAVKSPQPIYLDITRLPSGTGTTLLTPKTPVNGIAEFVIPITDPQLLSMKLQVCIV
jgi:hypothetical protein